MRSEVLNTTSDRAQKQWFALYTRPRHEKRVVEEVQEKGIEAYLPLTSVLRQWSDRKKWVDEPLFRGYVFIHGDVSERYHSVQTNGVVRVVQFQGKPARVRDEEIDRIKRILREVESIEVCDTMAVGDWVSIMRGPLTGIQGQLFEIQGSHRLVVTLSSINQGLRFSVDRSDVELIQQSN
ncbi:UpxY family transcription antiterminator [candidate division KSB1 bacterium]|nr:UpxY family transcription antiterminator [candidate division KSB1 bacterium]